MTDTRSPSTAEADLAFMRALVDGGRQPGLMAGPGATWRERTDNNVGEGDRTA